MLDKLVWSLIRWMVFGHTNFFFGIGMGSSGREKSDYQAISGVGKFGTGQGESDILKAQNFWSAILSGDMSKISTVLGPEFGTVNKQGQQAKKTAAEFGTRSGGTAATMNSIDDATRSRISSMISELTGASASNLGGMGENLLSTGLSGHEAAFSAAKVMHDENAAKWKDIFNSISSVIGAVAGMPGISGTNLGKGLTSAAGAF